MIPMTFDSISAQDELEFPSSTSEGVLFLFPITFDHAGLCFSGVPGVMEPSTL